MRGRVLTVDGNRAPQADDSFFMLARLNRDQASKMQGIKISWVALQKRQAKHFRRCNIALTQQGNRFSELRLPLICWRLHD